MVEKIHLFREQFTTDEIMFDVQLDIIRPGAKWSGTR